MATTKKNANANDVTTVEGFLAEFDIQYNMLAREMSWCSAGRRYAYEQLGVNPDNPYALLKLQAISDDHLNEDGKAAKAAEKDGMLAKLQAGARKTAEYAISSGNIGNSSAGSLSKAMNALGIAGKYETHNRHHITVVTDGYTSEHVSDDNMRAIRDAVSAAVSAVVAETEVNVVGTVNTSASSDKYSNGMLEWADAS